MNALADQFAGKRVAFVSITDDDSETLDRFLNGRPLKTWIVRDPDRPPCLVEIRQAETLFGRRLTTAAAFATSHEWGPPCRRVMEYVAISSRADVATLRTRAGDYRGRLGGKLDARLREWKPETAAEARERIAEVIELADHDLLDVVRSRAAEQEVLDLLDEPPAW